VPISFLVGDANGSGGVSASDIAMVKANSGLPVTGANFRADVIATGVINATDVSVTKSTAGNTLPP
jgi:hypothetical protein